MRFAPDAWAKLLYFRDRGDTEIGGFGISPPDDLLRVQDFVTVRQTASMASVAFEDTAVADFFDRQVDGGLKPAQFGRIWCHTHPGKSPQPSCTDEETFARVFGPCQYALMVILARDGSCYARLQFNVGPGGSLVVPVEVDYHRPFAASDPQAWEREYQANIQAEREVFAAGSIWDTLDHPGRAVAGDLKAVSQQRLCLDQLTLSDLAEMDDQERLFILSELGLDADLAGLEVLE